MTFDLYTRRTHAHKGRISHNRRLQRFIAAARLWGIAEEHGVTPTSLGQYATATGPYRHPAAGDGCRYGTGSLPSRHTPAGNALAERVYDACQPWNPHYLGDRALQFIEQGVQ